MYLGSLWVTLLRVVVHGEQQPSQLGADCLGTLALFVVGEFAAFVERLRGLSNGELIRDHRHTDVGQQAPDDEKPALSAERAVRKTL